MNLKAFIKTNPVRFWLTAIGWIIIPALSIKKNSSSGRWRNIIENGY